MKLEFVRIEKETLTEGFTVVLVTTREASEAPVFVRESFFQAFVPMSAEEVKGRTLDEIEAAAIDKAKAMGI